MWILTYNKRQQHIQFASPTHTHTYFSFWQCNCLIHCKRVCLCVTVCVNYLRLNKHLIFSACVHSNLLSLYICTHTYNIHTCIGMCTPTHILRARVFVCIVYLHLCFVLLGLPVYCEQLCSLSFSLSLSFRACTTPTHTYTRRAGLLGCVSVCVCA